MKPLSKAKSDAEWRQALTHEEYAVLRGHATEVPFTGKYVYNFKKGTYTCAACGQALFDSSTKFEAHCGWPNFYDAKAGAVELKEDNTYGMHRVEVRCTNCGSHLGHVFPDAPEQPTGQRFCINSVALDFKLQQK